MSQRSEVVLSCSLHEIGLGPCRDCQVWRCTSQATPLCCSVQPFAYNPNEGMFEVAPLATLPVGAVFASAGLGFSLSLLFFMDQNISSALVNTPNNKSVQHDSYLPIPLIFLGGSGVNIIKCNSRSLGGYITRTRR